MKSVSYEAFGTFTVARTNDSTNRADVHPIGVLRIPQQQ
jgi:hypothetical protein